MQNNDTHLFSFSIVYIQITSISQCLWRRYSPRWGLWTDNGTREAVPLSQPLY